MAAAVEIAQGCAAAGVKMLVDFHYSDFWADPGKQQVPKAWTGYTLEQKVDAVKEFTTDSLQKIAATGADVDMVQVGNETTNSFVGEKGTNYQDMCTLFQAGSEAVRAFNKDTKVVIHFTNPERANQLPNWAKRLHNNNVDYDILATSYYPYWHGTLENLKNQFKTVRETYGKDVMVAETSYAYTLEDTDGHDNTVRKGNNDSVTSYPFTPQGQADCIRDIMAAVNEAGGLGVYYWESAWITVGDTTGLSGDEYTARVEENKTIWEKFGSGWASSYAGEYDAEDAGKWYGGSAVDNQAMFYPNGAPNEGLRVWNYVKTGAVSKTISVDKIEALQEAVEIGGEYQLPETVNVTYNKGSEKEAVKWSEEDVAKIDNSKAGIYVVNGTVTFSKEVNSGDYAGQTSAPVTYTLTVKEKNLITDKDAAGFEKGTDFLIEGAGVKPIPCKEDVLDGAGTLHWYNASAVTSCVTYNKPLTLEAGCYTLEAIAMGFAGDTVSLNILDTDGNILFSGEPAEMAGWTLAKNECKIPSVNFKLEKETQVLLQVSLGISDGGWGSADCLYLHKHEDLSAKDLGDGTHQWSCDGCGAELYTEECTMIPAAVNDAAADKMASIVYQCGLCKAEETKEVSVQIQGIETAVNMKVGEKAKLEGGYVAALEPEGVTYAGHYTSGDEGIAKVDDEGNLTAVKAGKTEVAYTVTASVMIDGKEVSFVAAKSVAAVEIAQSQTDPGKNPNPGVKPDTKPGVSTGNKTTVNKVVATGDNSNPVLYMILAAGCMMIFAGIFVSRRRKVR